MPKILTPDSFMNKSPQQDWGIVKRWLFARKASAFGHTGYSLLYTGPDVAVSPDPDIYIPFAPRINNMERTRTMINDLRQQYISAVWLDGCPAGKMLFDGNALYKGLRSFFTKNGVFDQRGYERGADYVMSRVSRAYIKSAYGFAATAVCGASHKRIFYRYEMTPLINNPKIFAVDELPRQMAQEFSAINKDEAFQLICWAELLLSKHRLDMRGSDENKRDFLQRQYFLNGERKLMASRVTPLSKKWEHKREEKRYEIFSKHAAAIKHDALKDIIMDIRPLCPKVVSFPAHVGRRARIVL